MRDLLVMQQVQSLQRVAVILNHMKEQSNELKHSNEKVGSLESKLNKAKLALPIADQLKLDLATAEQNKGSSECGPPRGRSYPAGGGATQPMAEAEKTADEDAMEDAA
ncbi:hypothetical protein Acr_06g0008260 [Actinidia rufa]|uniref:Uncharacterized protein n=1 Tax=Actinidia rufa TaxID=165716 RepID=A0A7J0ERQ6_9ERIC|nr:hypothetical protein Acr_06g0008260 [Actinidia rufa]